MSVHVIADTRDKLSSVSRMLDQQHAVTSELLGGASLRHKGIDAVVVAADLGKVDSISALKAVSGKLKHVPKRIFLIDRKGRLSVVQAYALGATHVLGNPVSQAQLLSKLADGEAVTPSPGEIASVGQEAASAGAASIASMFSAVSSGTEVDVRAAKNAGSKIAESIAEDGLSNWLTTVRRHHEGTYQHCLLVTGVAPILD